jgi:hypothetical protein
MNILILHGIGGKAGIHWQQWLHDELVKAGHNVAMPTLPDAEHPDRKTWLDEIKGYMSNLSSKDTVIIGHSLGVPSALDYIEQADEPIKAFISVSGFSYPLNAELNDYFMKEKVLDFAKINNKIGKAYALYGDNDPYVSQKALKDLADELGVEPTVFHNGGHLNTDAGYTEFPELLDIIKGLK